MKYAPVFAVLFSFVFLTACGGGGGGSNGPAADPAAPPVIVIQPADMHITEGQSIQLAITVRSIWPATFRLYRNGTISQTVTLTSASLSTWTERFPITGSDGDQYKVEVENANDKVTSNTVTLFIQDRTSIPGTRSVTAEEAGWFEGLYDASVSVAGEDDYTLYSIDASGIFHTYDDQQDNAGGFRNCYQSPAQLGKFNYGLEGRQLKWHQASGTFAVLVGNASGKGTHDIRFEVDPGDHHIERITMDGSLSSATGLIVGGNVGISLRSAKTTAVTLGDITSMLCTP